MLTRTDKSEWKVKMQFVSQTLEASKARTSHDSIVIFTFIFLHLLLIHTLHFICYCCFLEHIFCPVDPEYSHSLHAPLVFSKILFSIRYCVR